MPPDVPRINIGAVCGKQHLRRCPHPQEVVHQPWVMKVILTGAKAWKDDKKKANDKYKPYSKKQGDLGKKTMC